MVHLIEKIPKNGLANDEYWSNKIFVGVLYICKICSARRVKIGVDSK